MRGESSIVPQTIEPAAGGTGRAAWSSSRGGAGAERAAAAGRRRPARRARRVPAALLLAGATLAAGAEPGAPSPEAELRRTRDEIARFERELQELGGRERGLLGEIEQLDAELRLRRAEYDEVVLRRAAVESELAGNDRTITSLEHAQRERSRYLRLRLRAIYKAGREPELRRLLGGAGVEDAWAGLAYAGMLSERDQRLVAAYRSDALHLGDARDGLARARSDLVGVERELEEARRALERSRGRQTAALARIRADQQLRRTAVRELAAAAEALAGRVAAGGPASAGPPPLDVRKFRGLLDWPADGPVRAGFGTIVHPQFQTDVPHPGWDIAAPVGDEIRAVFDGRVVFAEWMRGYGLTAIVDHGAGVMSVYAHSSVLTVQVGERVLRQQAVGRVGETGSLRGPLLYFELRVDGKPVDPGGWLRAR